MTASKQSQDETHQCQMYSKELLMMGTEDARNMQSFVTE